MPRSITFQTIHRDAFAALSGDTNPLHIDSQYAARTPYGECIMHGIGVCLAALGNFSQGRPLLMKRLHGDLRRPVYLDRPYTLLCREEHPRTILEIIKGTVVQARFTLVREEAPCNPMSSQEFHSATHRPTLLLTPRSDAYPLAPSNESSEYEIPLCNLARHDALAPFGLHPSQIPPHHLTALCWASYFIGMDFPGQQALFSEFTLDFGPTLTGPFSVTWSELREDPRYNLFTISGSGSALSTFTFKAFRRPLPPSLKAPPTSAPALALWRGTHALVTGAGRGFGSTLGQVLDASGASVVMNTRRKIDSKFRESVSSSSPSSLRFVEADLTREDECERLAQSIQEGLQYLDLIVLNATPPIRNANFAELDTSEITRFVSDTLSLAIPVMRATLPLLRSSGVIIALSTTYRIRPPPGFSAYLAAKAALEGFIQGLATEHPRHRFVIARLPRMATDQTAVPFSTEPAADPQAVACALLHKITDLNWTSNYMEIDLFSCDECRDRSLTEGASCL